MARPLLRTCLIILLIVLAIGISPVEALDEIVDDYEDTTQVDVTYQVIHNATLDVMELNFSTMTIPLYGEAYAREHDYYAGKTPITVYSLTVNEARMTSANVPQGYGHIYFHIDESWLSDKYIRVYWNGYYSGGAPRTVMGWKIIDEEWDRTNNAHFPEGGYFGNVLDELIPAPWMGWRGYAIDDNQVAGLNSSSTGNVTLSFLLYDAWNSGNTALYLNWLEINTGPGGTGNIVTVNFTTDNQNLVMEQGGTQDDYGYYNNTATPLPSFPYSQGAYSTTGWFNTTNLLNGLSYNATVILTNTSIPSGSINAEISPDGLTWTDLGALDAGYMALDLRALGLVDSILRFNLTRGLATETPRLHQIRLIYEGPGAGVPGTGLYDATPWLAIGIILALSMYLLADRSRK